MQNQKRSIALLLAVLVTALVTATMAALRAQDQGHQSSHESNREQQRAEFESQFPIVGYSSPEPTDPQERAKRRAKGKKYNNPPLKINERDSVATDPGRWTGLPAFPVKQSNAVILGEVTGTQAFLSNDRTGVYSEFTIRIGEVLKANNQTALLSGNSVAVERRGGRVQFPSGHIFHYWVSGQGMPRLGGRYLLFLTQNGDDYQILTGYEIRDGHVFLLDNPGLGHPITSYKGADESSFLNDVRAAIANQTNQQ
ncbi:MAG: hypothetical protein AUG51_18730 [Acidobacteria bacterium 13_1_20CM_3_53_8]|nr:MAG: hypothetical protein AUG51_18730 [Acidobacteria bacterium 13_1_20CM_3_53_8]